MPENDGVDADVPATRYGLPSQIIWKFTPCAATSGIACVWGISHEAEITVFLNHIPGHSCAQIRVRAFRKPADAQLLTDYTAPHRYLVPTCSNMLRQQDSGRMDAGTEMYCY